MNLQSFTYPNGVTLSWDGDLAIGDLISGYRSGYHIVTGLRFGNEPDVPPIVEMVQVFRDNGEPSPKRKSSCHASYCKRFTASEIEAQFNKQIEEALFLKEQLLGAVNS